MAEIRKQKMTYERAAELIVILSEAIDVDGISAVVGCVEDAILARETRFELGEVPVDRAARVDFFDAYAFVRMAHHILSQAQDQIDRIQATR
jgi:hypothetical protein